MWWSGGESGRHNHSIPQLLPAPHSEASSAASPGTSASVLTAARSRTCAGFVLWVGLHDPISAPTKHHTESFEGRIPVALTSVRPRLLDSPHSFAGFFLVTLCFMARQKENEHFIRGTRGRGQSDVSEVRARAFVSEQENPKL